MKALLLLIASVGCLGYALADQNPPFDRQTCVAALRKPTYSALARQARITGTAKAHIEVAPDGVPKGVAVEGHPLLADGVKPSILGSRLDARCGGELEVIYRFGFDERLEDLPQPTVKYRQPNEFLVTVGVPVIVCAYRARLKKPLLQRLFSWF
ncbi:MAG: hypothetical protein ABI823_07195 [Bryobacteraceae bacterium]